jgi:hypothetical protein
MEVSTRTTASPAWRVSVVVTGVGIDPDRAPSTTPAGRSHVVSMRTDARTGPSSTAVTVTDDGAVTRTSPAGGGHQL